MNQKDQTVATASPRPRKFKWVVIIIIALIAVVIVMNLPRGYSADLSLIGKGKPAIVLVRDKNSMGSMALLEVMHDIRNQNSAKIEFLVTDVNTPEGNAFIAAYNAAPTTLVFFDGSGNPLKLLYPPQNADSLQLEITSVLKIAK